MKLQDNLSIYSHLSRINTRITISLHQSSPPNENASYMPYKNFFHIDCNIVAVTGRITFVNDQYWPTGGIHNT